MPTISLTNVWIGSTTRVLPHTLCVPLLQTCGYFNFSEEASLPTQMPKTTSLLVPLLVRWPGARRGGTAKWQHSLCACVLSTGKLLSQSLQYTKEWFSILIHFQTGICLHLKNSFNHGSMRCTVWILRQYCDDDFWWVPFQKLSFSWLWRGTN